MVQSTCLTQRIHPDLALNIIVDQKNQKFISTLEMILMKKTETSIWINSQFQNQIFVDPNTVRRLKDKIIGILAEVTDKIEGRCF